MKKYLHFILSAGIFLLAVVFYFSDPLKLTIFPRCPFNVITGYYCPGCGSQRAIHSMLHLNLAGTASYNFLFLPAFFLIIYHYLHPILNRLLNWKLPNVLYLKYTPVVILVIVLLFWILRNIPLYPFSLLAPG